MITIVLTAGHWGASVIDNSYIISAETESEATADLVKQCEIFNKNLNLNIDSNLPQQDFISQVLAKAESDHGWVTKLTTKTIE